MSSLSSFLKSSVVSFCCRYWVAEAWCMPEIPRPSPGAPRSGTIWMLVIMPPSSWSRMWQWIRTRRCSGRIEYGSALCSRSEQKRCP